MRETRACVQPVSERVRQRQGGEDRDRLVADEERDGGFRGERRDGADRRAVRQLDPQCGRSRKQPRDLGPVALRDRGLEVRVLAQALGGALRPLALVLERDERGAEPGLQPVVGATRHAPLRHLAEAPDRGRQRQHREREKRADQLEFEAPQHPALQFPRCMPITPLEVFSARGGRIMRPNIARALTAVLATAGAAMAIALPTLILGENKAPARAFALPAPGGRVVIEAASPVQPTTAPRAEHKTASAVRPTPLRAAPNPVRAAVSAPPAPRSAPADPRVRPAVSLAPTQLRAVPKPLPTTPTRVPQPAPAPEPAPPAPAPAPAPAPEPSAVRMLASVA